MIKEIYWTWMLKIFIWIQINLNLIKTQYNLPSSGPPVWLQLKIETSISLFETFCAHSLQKSSFIIHMVTTYRKRLRDKTEFFCSFYAIFDFFCGPAGPTLSHSSYRLLIRSNSNQMTNIMLLHFLMNFGKICKNWYLTWGEP